MVVANNIEMILGESQILVALKASYLRQNVTTFSVLEYEKKYIPNLPRKIGFYRTISNQQQIILCAYN